MPTHGPPVLDYAPTTQPPGVSHATAAILKEGWMHKLSYMGSGWKKRYVAVTEDSELRYWAPTEIGGWELKGVITLEDAEFSQIRDMTVDGAEGRFPLSLKIASSRSVSVKHQQWWILRDYFFAAEESELESWLDVLNQARNDVELVDRAYCLFSDDEEGGESPRERLDKQYTMVDGGTARDDLQVMSRQVLLSTQTNVAHAGRKLAEGMHTLFRTIVDGPPPEPQDKRHKGDPAGRPIWILGTRYDVGPDSPRSRASWAQGQGRPGGVLPQGHAVAPVVHVPIGVRDHQAVAADVGRGVGVHAAVGADDAGAGAAPPPPPPRLAPPPRRPPPAVVRADPEAVRGRPLRDVLDPQDAQGGVQCQRQVGQWFGPDTVCRVLKNIWTAQEGNWPCHTAGLLYVEDRCIYRDMAEECAASRPAYPGIINTNSRTEQARIPCPWRPLIILIPVRLGPEGKINSAYIPKLAAYLGFPQSLGFVGGRPRHSYYFVGVRGYHTYYLDPHVTQAYQPIRRNTNCSSFHCRMPEKMSLAHIDPSLALGFYCDDKSDFEDLFKRIKQLTADDSSPILSVGERAPDYLCMDDIDEDVLVGGMSARRGCKGGMLQRVLYHVQAAASNARRSSARLSE
eukprot:CAMPEP_0180346618 /NCGR_PEP_ID=MMETSP0989-20121125/3972_1 /TAXON_ID=697907 /ORGANISM="non described non described, Strain CCMP2293" /LENGTH=624 /DNA_ID=CAMNT_0022335767 /DNA_START=59 /DNA_END=1930 /DNA_ORIENTATION=-